MSELELFKIGDKCLDFGIINLFVLCALDKWPLSGIAGTCVLNNFLKNFFEWGLMKHVIFYILVLLSLTLKISIFYWTNNNRQFAMYKKLKKKSIKLSH